MLEIEPTGAVLGATVRGIDLGEPLAEHDFGRVLLALGCYGLLSFPDQHIDLAALERFSEQLARSRGTRSAMPIPIVNFRKSTSSRI
jgi:taurine dioxygenase